MAEKIKSNILRIDRYCSECEEINTWRGTTRDLREGQELRCWNCYQDMDISLDSLGWYWDPEKEDFDE